MKISQIKSFNHRINNNFIPFAKSNATSTNSNSLNQIQDTVQFTGKKLDTAKAQYEAIVKENAECTNYKEATIHTPDIRFLLNLNNKDFKKIISKPVQFEDIAGRNSNATIFFYTDALATEKLLNKLNDKKAAFDILKIQKDWRGTSALHTAAYAHDPVKAESILTSVNKNDRKALMKLEEIDDDAHSIAILEQHDETLELFKQYYNEIYKTSHK